MFNVLQAGTSVKQSVFIYKLMSDFFQYLLSTAASPSLLSPCSRLKVAGQIY